MYKKLINLIIKYKEIIIYLIFGILTTTINLITKYLLLFTVLEASNAFQLQLSVIISWIIAVLFAYFTNRIFVFKSENKNKLKEFINFTIARVLTLLLEMFIMWFFITLLQFNSKIYVIIFTLVSQFIVLILNYVFSKLFIFKKNG